MCCGNVTNKYAATGEWRTGNDGNYQGRQFIGQRKERVMDEVMIEWKIIVRKMQSYMYTQSKYLYN